MKFSSDPECFFNGFHTDQSWASSACHSCQEASTPFDWILCFDWMLKVHITWMRKLTVWVSVRMAMAATATDTRVHHSSPMISNNLQWHRWSTRASHHSPFVRSADCYAMYILGVWFHKPPLLFFIIHVSYLLIDSDSLEGTRPRCRTDQWNRSTVFWFKIVGFQTTMIFCLFCIKEKQIWTTHRRLSVSGVTNHFPDPFEWWPRNHSHHWEVYSPRDWEQQETRNYHFRLIFKNWGGTLSRTSLNFWILACTDFVTYVGICFRWLAFSFLVASLEFLSKYMQLSVSNFQISPPINA